jgi:hypothetical protein
LKPHDPVDDTLSILSFLKIKKESFNCTKLRLNK